ncbi:ATP synthase F1 subunit epsilon [Ignavigranum ruoffiae]|uniref:ATP synthase epsilon chain n=2 Tax=Ignavigranum ruoffiae TaxID=89093 RepID=A0A1H9ANK1_9LACT|nr:ATP synthase F1 subunit epsilon [Ignavigranum ruoffiae]UPQ85756.1 ATP synthase F1 subunit epsilon [Ignavigranum ruoffiae]SEP77508.1 ATP synthase F1 subcomplex epsilon subunit [Ignavigranum ruoffiae]
MTETKKRFMRCEIITPQGLIYSHRVKSISLQSQNSGMTLLYNHMPIVTTVDIGVIKVIRVTDDKELPNYIAVNGGVLEMHDNVCTIVATYAIRARDIDDGAVLIEKQEAEAAAAAALSRKDVVAYKRAQLSLKRALNMLEVSKLKP